MPSIKWLMARPDASMHAFLEGIHFPQQQGLAGADIRTVGKVPIDQRFNGLSRKKKNCFKGLLVSREAWLHGWVVCDRTRVWGETFGA